jgi:hypothetical protein
MLKRSEQALPIKRTGKANLGAANVRTARMQGIRAMRIPLKRPGLAASGRGWHAAAVSGASAASKFNNNLPYDVILQVSKPMLCTYNLHLL